MKTLYCQSVSVGCSALVIFRKMSPLWLLGVVLILMLYVKDRIKRNKIYTVDKLLPGPKAWPILGNSLEFATDSVGIFSKMVGLSKHYGRFYRLWNQGNFFVICSNCRDVEAILGDNVNITKSDLYKFIIPWIGYGLLTSTGKKWKLHRRIITPTFFFKILEDFLIVFNKNGEIMCETLEKEVGKGPFDMFAYVNRVALDNICETAMGIDFNVQRTQDSSYLRAIKTICQTASLRLYKVWLMPDLLFNFTPYASKQKEAIVFIHKSTENIIKQKREALLQHTNEKPTEENDDGYGKKKVKAFLDLLLEYAGSQLTDQEICEEVNTFMFEGHDTISSAAAFAFYELASNPDVQEKVFAEQLQVLESIDAPLTTRHLNEMRYLEQVVKETLRLYPSVPMAGRELEADLQLPDGPCLPKGTNLFVDFYSLHRDPTVFPNPNKFNPENFADVGKRHPYAFVPFSAGARNCIGQKFAMMEMKATISHVVRNFKLRVSNDPEHKLRLANELVLISKTGQMIEIEKRT